MRAHRFAQACSETEPDLSKEERLRPDQDDRQPKGEVEQADREADRQLVEADRKREREQDEAVAARELGDLLALGVVLVQEHPRPE